MPEREYLMPSLGADMAAGTLVAWRVKPGDSVRRGQVVGEVETDKGVIEIEIWQDGVVSELRVREGETVPVGTVLATLDDGPTGAGRAEAREPVREVAAVPEAGGLPPGPARGSPASPAARRRPRELGLDLSRIAGTGPHGAITHADVERAAAPSATAGAGGSPPGAQPAGTADSEWRPAGAGQSERHIREDLPAMLPHGTTSDRSSGAGDSPPGARAASAQQRMRDAIAAAMSRSNREIPHYHLATDVDMSAALAWLGARNATLPVSARLLPAALQVGAVARACREVPEMNGFFVDGVFRPAEGVHVGVALALRGGGLVAPALHDADRRTASEIMAALTDLILRARGGRLRSSELADATLTVTNLGDTGVESVHGVIYPPQVAIVGFGRITERPWAEHGLLGVRPVVTATLAADHRVSDGHRGAAFLTAVARLLGDPAAWAG